MAEHLTTDEELCYIYNLLQEESLYHPFSHTTDIVSHSLIESVAVLRFCITWLVKWYYAVKFRTGYIQSQVTADQTKKDSRNIELKMCLQLIDKNIKMCSLYNTVLLFLLKNVYFLTGFDEVIYITRYQKLKIEVIPKSQGNGVSDVNANLVTTCHYLSLRIVNNC